MALWRNGSASDSRSEGWVFESLWGQMLFPTAINSSFPAFCEDREEVIKGISYTAVNERVKK